MLQNYNDPEKWLAVKNSKVWDLEDETKKVQKSLELSFDNLPNSMAKQCFAYCSIFKKDKVMEREELVRLWMALGLVQADEEKDKEVEDVGNDIFQILVCNSLFQDVERDEYGHITRCSIHDLVHDLSLSLSKHENLCLVDATNDDIACIPQVKHLAFYQEENEDDEFTAKNRGGANGNDVGVLEGLQPPQDVKKLTIINFSGDNFPDWVMKMAIHIEGKWTPLDKLVEIRLSGCSSCLSLPTLEHLPHLRELELLGMDNLTCLRSCDVTGSTKPLSPSLRSLRLDRMERLEK
ncbi:unnamed protein product [Lactuca virosa]|uniref:NB-ARC domain-containing protein n=1 Tax=Lactuca virosa TaxID=75947 RepID=A0AAU9NDN7_9ASTR|nr:unnamed protein product [Lactuca virosa]